MKNPNGYGCIKHLSGSRRNPWAFVVTEEGKQKVIGYFTTKLEALAFQVDYNQSHGLHCLSDNKITFAELYTRWLPKHIEYSSVSDSTIHSYESSYKHCVYLYDVPVAEIKYSQNPAGRGLEHIKTFSGSSFRYYSGYDIADKRLTWLAVGI